MAEWTELGKVRGAHGQLTAWRNPGGGVTLIDGASNNVVIPRLSLAGVAEILQRAAMPRDPGEPPRVVPGTVVRELEAPGA